jgi:diguanylate cyclase (GGDEF)-like protein
LKSVRFGIAAIVICGIAILAARIQVGAWVHQAKVLTARQDLISARLTWLRNLQDALLDLETGERGYLMTGDEGYLESQAADRRDFDAALTGLKFLFRDEPQPLAEIASIGKVGRDRVDQLARTIRLRRASGFAAAVAHVRNNEGKRTMSEFRGRVKSLALRLVDARSAATAAEMGRYRDLSRLGAVVAVLILALVSLAIGFLGFSVYRLDELQRQRQREAMHDALTGLPNRRYLSEWLNLTLAAARRSGQPLALLFFDLDGFKAVNDRFGHDAGDQVLRATAARLQRCMRASDFVARLGGDEFVAALPSPPSSPDLAALIERLQHALAAPPIPELETGAVSASIGVAWFPRDGDSVDTLITVADHAMYDVKESRRADRVHSAEAADTAA